MGDAVVAAVCHNRRQIGYLQRRGEDFSLADGKGHDGGEAPVPLAVALVVELRRRYVAAQLGGEVAAQLVAEPEAHHHLPPVVVRLFRGTVFRVLQDAAHNVAEVAVARHHHRILHIQGRAVVVAAQRAAAGSIDVSAVAGVIHRRLKNPVLQAHKPVYEFEHRSRRVRRGHGPVVERLVLVLRQLAVVAPEVGQHVYVYAGAGHHRQDLTRRRLYGHQAPFLAVHQPLAVVLQVGVYGGGDVFAGDGLHIVLSVFVRVFLAAAGVALVDVPAGLAAQVFLACRLKPGAAVIVAGAIIWMRLEELGIHLGDVAQQVAAGVEGVLPDAARLALEAREAVLLLGKLHVC